MLEGIEAVRLRPGMYIGWDNKANTADYTTRPGEVVDNLVIDEAMGWLLAGTST